MKLKMEMEMEMEMKVGQITNVLLPKYARQRFVCSCTVLWDVCSMIWVASLELALLLSLSKINLPDDIKYMCPDRPVSVLDEARFGVFPCRNSYMLVIFPTAAVCSFFYAI